MIIYNDGRIDDEFYKENKLHGPSLIIETDGRYDIDLYEHDRIVSRKYFKADGTPW